MAYDDVARKANLKYQKDKLKDVRFRVKKAEAAELEAEAAARGQSVRRFIIEAINAKAGRNIVIYDDSEKSAERD